MNNQSEQFILGIRHLIYWIHQIEEKFWLVRCTLWWCSHATSFFNFHLMPFLKQLNCLGWCSLLLLFMSITPRKEPQMRSCSGHLSNKNVLTNFLNESKLKDGSFILAGRSFQIAGPQTLNDLRPNVTVLVLGMYSCPEVADRNFSGQVLQKLRCSPLPDKKVPVHSNIGTSEWRSWKLSFVALVTNEGCATLAWCNRISEYQWWTVLSRSGHSADVAEVPRWHCTVDCYSRLLQ